MKQTSTQIFLLVDQARFQNITQRLLNLDQNALADITEILLLSFSHEFAKQENTV